MNRCDYYVSAHAWGRTGRPEAGSALPGDDAADHGKGWLALALGARDGEAAFRALYAADDSGFPAWLDRVAPGPDGAPRCGMLSMRFYTAVLRPEAAREINPEGCKNTKDAAVNGDACPCPLGDCASVANAAQHAACAAAIAAVRNPRDVFDCWLDLRRVDADLAECLGRFRQRGGVVERMPEALTSKKARHAGERRTCAEVHTAATATRVNAVDGGYARLFGFPEDACCAGAFAARSLATPTDTHQQASCVALHAQHKSAGNTLKQTLDAHAPATWGKKGASTRCDDAQFDYDALSCVPVVVNKATGPTWLHGGYALASDMAKRCFVVSNFREPVARLVSAQLHCVLHDNDPLCGDRPAAWFEAANASAMARFWGNYGLTNLLLSDTVRGDVARGPPRRALRAATPKRNDGSLKVWQRFRADLRGGDDPRTDAGAKNLDLVLARLPSLFDVVVVVERWDDSMALLDCALPLRGGSWKTLAANHLNTHGSERHGGKSGDALAAARADASVAEELRGDARLYEAGLALFEELHAAKTPCAPSAG